MKTALSQPIDFYDEESFHEAAIETAWKLNRPATYDAHYLALAEKLGAEFWTLDQRLFNAVRHQLPWVHLVGSTE
jgi:predicted nucleic acid-binding protein